MQNVNILAVQPHLTWENTTENLRHLAQLISSDVDYDIVVLPEMFATGFTMQPEKYAQSMDGQAVQWMKELSKKRAVCGSLSIVEDGKYFNRLIWAENGEVRAHYDKRHLFSHGKETQHYSAGNEKLVMDYKGIRIALFVCYDLRFPVWCRNTEHAELMIFVANWPHVRISAWDKLLQARAIENQCYVLGVNRVGEDGNGIYHSGNSALIDARGECLWKSENSEIAKALPIDFQPLRDFRMQFPVLEDMDLFTVKK